MGEDELDDRGDDQEGLVGQGGDDQEDSVGQGGDRHEMLVRVEWAWPGRKSKSMIRKNCSEVKSRLVVLKCMSAGVVNPLSAVLDNFGDNKVRFWSTTCTTTTTTTTTDIGGIRGQLLALRAR